MNSLFNMPAVVVVIALAVSIAADIRQSETYGVLILPWVMVGLICYFSIGADVVLLAVLQGSAVPVFMVALILASIQFVHALGRRHH